MSVKAFLQKYFQPEPKKIVPEEVLEPMIGTERRKVVPEASKPFHIFVDGACSDNGKRSAKGGYGVHVYANPSLDVSMPLFPDEPQTNNRAELRAIITALDLINQYDDTWKQTSSCYYIWSDSEYSIHCLTKWAKGWAHNHWKKRDGGLIQNLDLIKPIFERLQRMPRVSLHHVRGHQDLRKNEFPYDGNFKADALARQAVY